MFTHLHVHSSYSLQDATGRIKYSAEEDDPKNDPNESIIDRAKRFGMTHVAMTDHHTMMSTYLFEVESKRKGIQPIYGIDLLVDGFPLVLLASNVHGLKALFKASSYANSYGMKDDVANITCEQLTSFLHHQGDWIVLTGGVSSELSQSCLGEDRLEAYIRANLVLQKWIDAFGEEHVYIEITRHGLPEEEQINPMLIELSANIGIPLVATNDVHYLDPEHAYARSILTQFQSQSMLPWENHTQYNDQFHFASEEEMRSKFFDLPEAIENTNVIAKRCEGVVIPKTRKLPSFPVPTGETSESYFRKQCFEGLSFRGLDQDPVYVQQLEFEIETIIQMNFPDYFLIVWDFMKFAKDSGIPVGPGRGSAGGCLAAYCLRITEIDPLKHELYFERFLNPMRVTLPDVDIDFCQLRREEMLTYVRSKYGEERVCQIVNINTLGAKSLVKDIGRVLGLSYASTDEMTKQIGKDDTFFTMKEQDVFQELMDSDDRIVQLFEIGTLLSGLPRNTGVHAAGVVISQENVDDMVPLMKRNDIFITQWDMAQIEGCGLLKMDFLGLKTLSVMQETFHLLEKRGVQMGFYDFPMHDAKTIDELRTGRTHRVFQLESSGMQKTIRELKPTSFEDVVALLALYRPGPMDYIPVFIENKERGSFSVPHPVMEPILRNTNGIILYQEQIQKIAQNLAGYSLGEADILRRAISKKKDDVLKQQRSIFTQKAEENGVSVDVANAVYDAILPFAEYGFNKAHAVGYAYIAWQTAYLKAHYPVEFMCANLTIAIGDSKKLNIILQEVKRMGIPILPPSLFDSKGEFSVENGSIRYGLRAIRNVGDDFVDQWLEAIANQQPTCLEDAMRMVSYRSYNRAMWENLIHAGALDQFGGRKAMLKQLPDLMEDARRFHENRQLKQFDLWSTGIFQSVALPLVEEANAAERLRQEQLVLETSLSGHPLDDCADLVDDHVSSISDLLDEEDVNHLYHDRLMRFACVFEDIQTFRTKVGEQMASAMIGDQAGSVKCVIFPRRYMPIRNKLKSGIPLIVEGKVVFDRKENEYIVHVQDIEWISQDDDRIYIEIDSIQQEELLSIVKTTYGITPVYLIHKNTKKLIPTTTKIRLNQRTRSLLSDFNYTRIRYHR